MIFISLHIMNSYLLGAQNEVLSTTKNIKEVEIFTEKSNRINLAIITLTLVSSNYKLLQDWCVCPYDLYETKTPITVYRGFGPSCFKMKQGQFKVFLHFYFILFVFFHFFLFYFCFFCFCIFIFLFKFLDTK